jgi:hypothetical protein
MNKIREEFKKNPPNEQTIKWIEPIYQYGLQEEDRINAEFKKEGKLGGVRLG